LCLKVVITHLLVLYYKVHVVIWLGEYVNMARPTKNAQGKGNVDWTKEKLILAAAEQFSIHGFEGASLSKIREKVGVKNSTIMYHFKSKQGLYLAVNKHLEQSFRELVETIVTTHSSLDVLQRFRVFCCELSQWCQKEQTFTAIIMQEMLNKQLHSSNSSIYQNIGLHFQQVIKFLQGEEVDHLWRKLDWQVFIINVVFSILVGQGISVAIPMALGIPEDVYKQQQLDQVIQTYLLANIVDQELVKTFIESV